MASLITHLLVGKYVFRKVWHSELTASNCSTFLLGCILVDVNRFSNIDRYETHFVERIHKNSGKSFNSTCTTFLNQLDKLLLRPWESLSKEEQGFIAGYLCHLAADEIWRKFGWQLLKILKMSSMPQLPVSGTVLLTAYDMLCKQEFTDFGTIAPALNRGSIPDVLKNIPHDAFLSMWDIIRSHIMDGSTPESYIQLLCLSGKTDMELGKTRKEHELYWEKAITLIRETDGVYRYVRAATELAVNVIPQLWKN